MGQQVADQYSLLHFAVGIVSYFWGLGFLVSLVIHTVFEWAENTPTGIHFINVHLHDIWPGGKPQADSLANCVGDTIAFGIGWLSAKALDDLGKTQKWY